MGLINGYDRQIVPVLTWEDSARSSVVGRRSAVYAEEKRPGQVGRHNPLKDVIVQNTFLSMMAIDLFPVDANIVVSALANLRAKFHIAN